MAVVPKISLLGPPLDHKKQFMAPTKKKKDFVCGEGQGHTVWGRYCCSKTIEQETAKSTGKIKNNAPPPF